MERSCVGIVCGAVLLSNSPSTLSSIEKLSSIGVSLSEKLDLDGEAASCRKESK